MDYPSIMLVGAFDDDLPRVREALEPIAKVENQVPALTDARRMVTALNPSLVVLRGTEPWETVFALTRELKDDGGHPVVIGPHKDADLILSSLRAGAEEFVVDGDLGDLRRAVRSVMSAHRTTRAAKIVTLFPAKGGVGATAIATNLAGSLAARGERVCVLDLNLQFGDVLAFLDIQSGSTISEVVQNLSRLDREMLDAGMARHASGVWVLAQNDKVEDAEKISPEHLRALLGFLRHHYDTVLVDGLRSFDDHSLPVLDLSDSILLLVTQDVPAVRNAQRCLDLFRRLGYGDDRVRLVINRYQASSRITMDLVAKVSGTPVVGKVRNDFAALIRAINRGTLLGESAPRSKLKRDIDALVPLVSDAAVRAPRRGVFAKLFKRERADHGTQ